MTDISKEAIAEAWEEFEVCARPTGSDGDLDLYDTDGMQEHAYTLHQIAVAQAARIAELEAAERKSRGYRVGHIAGYHAGIRQAAKVYREGKDWDVFATADCAILTLIDKEPTP